MKDVQLEHNTLYAAMLELEIPFQDDIKFMIVPPKSSYRSPARRASKQTTAARIQSYSGHQIGQARVRGLHIDY